MLKDRRRMEDSNRSPNPRFDEVSDPRRRRLLQGGLAAAAGGVLGLAACAVRRPAPPGPATLPLLGFSSVPMDATDGLLVPPGYRAQVLYRWGDATGLVAGLPDFRDDASNSAAEQAQQAGMHHDGMQYFPLDGSARGLLALNHEYVDDGLLHPDGTRDWSAGKVRKSMAAHGVSVVETVRGVAGWQLVRPSPYARRITAATPMRLSGPAAGHALLRTAADPAGRQVLGTLANCASGRTPWGTYLTCEENFSDYFEGPSEPDAHQRRWNIRRGKGRYYRWFEHEPRFDARLHPNEPNRFGWVVEIDPADPESVPVKRTALGRAAHEGAALAQTADGRVVAYMGEDAAFEYLYKFVSRDAVRAGGAAANRELLDHGTLYVARFESDGSGSWLPLVHGQGPLTAANGFADQGEVLVRARQASDALGATKMDRPEWTAIDPLRREIYCSLTNNVARGASGRPGADAANPRAPNPFGHILRWQEDGDLDARRFRWSHFVLAGDAEAGGTTRGDAFACPDGLWVDGRGLLWVATDVAGNALGRSDFAHLPRNQLLACDPAQGVMRRFLVGPPGCEITGLTTTPDLRSFFLNIQHPGESPAGRSDPAQPTRVSAWPDGRGRPRSATVVVTREDGGVIGG